MPVYEFACNACGDSTSVFVRSMSAGVTAKCERCGSSDLRRLLSRFAVIRSGGGIEALTDADFAGLDPTDPRAAAAWARKMQLEMGDDGDAAFEEMIDRLEHGESLEGLDGGDDDGFDDASRRRTGF
jgi:putative FmdB family regulatory protein